MKAFVMEAYHPAGGTYMAYHLGRILQEVFGYEAVAVGRPREESAMFDYPLAMPSVPVERMCQDIAPHDIFICNPSYSEALYGLRLPGRKISYVQNVRYFRILDVFFDHYVFVSDWVRRFVVPYYGIDGPVIPAFIRRDIFHGALPWERRSSSVTLSARKQEGLVFQRLLDVYHRIFPGDDVAFNVVPVTSQAGLAAQMASSRYYLSLDVMEGFGLPMLEAMSSGCAVVGWDSGGCREFAVPGENCLLARYGDFEALARHLHAVLQDDHLASALAERARSCAASFGQDAFDHSWSEWFASILPDRLPAL
jgi:hypothetical protein